MSSNQIGGFFNRLEASRKYLFGSVGVLGTANDSIITGILILRGQEVKPVVEVAPDFESYDFKKLDMENAADKTFFEGAVAWDLEVDGRKWADGKNVSYLLSCNYIQSCGAELPPLHSSSNLYCLWLASWRLAGYPFV
jgi:elongation factor 1-gamma